LRPILYNATETVFDSYGLGEIDANKATVTRERNGNYSLYIEYPVGGSLAPLFKQDMRIKADAGVRTKNQTFYISRIVKDSSHVIKIYAKHISHLTETMGIVHGTTVVGDANAALARWSESLVGGVEFRTWSDIETEGKASWTVDKFKTAREALGGVEGSILDVWGGEYEFDNTTIKLHRRLGRQSPTVLEYGRNILSAEDDEDANSVYTSVYPFATYTPESQSHEEGKESKAQDPVTVTLSEKIVDSQWVGQYAERRVAVVDFSSKYGDKQTPNAESLRTFAKEYMKTNRIGIPKINTKIEYVDLAKTLDYADMSQMEEVELCDILPIYYPTIGLTNDENKVVVVNYDVLNDRNESIELGTIGQSMRSALTNSVSNRLDYLEAKQSALEETFPAYLVNAKGNKVWYRTPAKNIEQKIGDTWFEKNGRYDRIYIWNGEMWEKVIDTEDVARVQKDVDQQLESVNNRIGWLQGKNDQKISDLLKKSNATQELAEISKQLAQEAKDVSNSTGQELSQYKQDNEQNLSILKTQTTQIDGKAGQALNKANQTAVETSNLIANLRTDLNGKVSLSEFQQLRETAKIHERIIGKTENDAPDKLSRLVMSSEIFQTEVGKYVTDDNNLIVNSMTMNKHTLIGNSNPKVDISVNDGIFTIKAQGLTGYNWSGFSLPIYVKKIYKDETYTLGFKYRIREYPDVSFAFNVKNHGLNKTLLWSNIGEKRPPLNEWQEFQKTFTVQEDFAFGEDYNYPFYIFLAKNGWVEFKEPILVRGSRTGTYKPSQFDDAYKKSNEAKDLAENAQNKAENAQNKAENAQAKAIEVAENARQAQQTAEATRTQMTLLSNSWSVKALNGPGDVLGAINLNPDGSVKINEGLISVGEKTYIKDGVIKKSMIGNAQIGTAHIGEIDASQARIINISSKNIVTDGLTANVIRGGNLSSLNGATNFDLQSGWLKMNGEGVGIFNQFDSRPIQYLVFHKGAINGKLGSYTALMSNSHGWVNMDDGSAGIQIWNTNDNTTAINLYGDEIAMMYNATDQRGIIFDNVKNEIKNVETMKVGTIGASHEIWIKGKSLAKVFDLINQNFIGIENWFKRNKLGSPGRYDVRI
jgi:phage minor structural protein, N-terminal domain protein